MNKVILAIASFLTLSSCQKEINLKLKDTESRFVVDGNITNEAGPYYVKLSKSVPFNESSIYPDITNALVVIDDSQGSFDTLTHIGGGVYETHTIQGVVGRTYNLKILHEGQTYAASSTMPQAVPLDSIGISKTKFGAKETLMLVPFYTDPMAVGNNYKFDIFVNGVKSKAYLVWNDALTNGETNERPLRASDLSDLKSGDHVTVVLNCINAFEYNYFFTLSQISSKGPGGGTTPTNPHTNLSNGAIGLFSAHTVSSKSIIVP